MSGYTKEYICAYFLNQKIQKNSENPKTYKQMHVTYENKHALNIELLRNE